MMICISRIIFSDVSKKEEDDHDFSGAEIKKRHKLRPSDSPLEYH